MNRMTELADWIRSHDNFAVISHIHPDGDTLGSSSALNLALKAMGKRAFPCDNDGVPHMYAFVRGMNEFVSSDDVPFKPEALIYVDTSVLDRSGDKGAFFDESIPKAQIDHHGTNPKYADVNVIDENAAATGELMFELIKELGVSISPEIAENLYTAIVCDTNNFSIPSVTGETFRKAGELTDAGIDIKELCRKLIRVRSKQRTLLLGKAVADIKTICGGKIAYTALPRTVFNEVGAGDEDTEGIVNILNDMENVEIAVLATELEDGRTKFSLRSPGKCNVSGFAVKLGGGGHEKAAGITMDLPLEEALRAVLSEAEKAVGGL